MSEYERLTAQWNSVPLSVKRANFIKAMTKKAADPVPSPVVEKATSSDSSMEDHFFKEMEESAIQRAIQMSQEAKAREERERAIELIKAEAKACEERERAIELIKAEAKACEERERANRIRKVEDEEELRWFIVLSKAEAEAREKRERAIRMRKAEEDDEEMRMAIELSIALENGKLAERSGTEDEGPHYEIAWNELP
jgi:hypothetical protein